MVGQRSVTPSVKAARKSQDHLTRTQGFASGKRWTDCITAPTGGAGVCLQQVIPREIPAPLCSWWLSGALWHTQGAWQDSAAAGPAQRAVHHVAKNFQGSRAKTPHTRQRAAPIMPGATAKPPPRACRGHGGQGQRAADNTPALKGRHLLRNASGFEEKSRHPDGQVTRPGPPPTRPAAGVVHCHAGDGRETSPGQR